jgi:hypothetical protein
MKPIKPHEGITFQQLEQLTGGTTNAQEALQAGPDEAKATSINTVSPLEAVVKRRKKMLPTGINQKSDFPVTPADTYKAQLKGITLRIFNEYQAVVDGVQLQYQGLILHFWLPDIEAIHEEMWLRLSTHPESALYNRLYALSDGKMTKTSALDWTKGDNFKEGISYSKGFKPQKDDPTKGHKKDVWICTGTANTGSEGSINDLKIDGQSIFDKYCLLAIKITPSGKNKIDAGGAQPLPSFMKAQLQTAQPQPQQQASAPQ